MDQYVLQRHFWENEQMKNSLSSRVRPVLKWAGGKTQLLPQIAQRYPQELGKKISKYAEPFIGGGAVLFDILSKYSLDAVYISDINEALINMYVQIKKNVENLICELSSIEKIYWQSDEAERKRIYTQKRNIFNQLISNPDETNAIQRAYLLIFLNRTCFNGLYRVNRRGFFNVPIGSYKKPLICDTENLRKVSEALKNVEVVCGNYAQCETFVDQNTFVYFDPPYRPLSTTSNFTSYTEQSFDDKEQEKLALFAKKLSEKKASVLLSNSDPKNTDPNDSFFDDLYSDFRISRVCASRMINSNAQNRGAVSELLIMNYAV